MKVDELSWTVRDLRDAHETDLLLGVEPRVVVLLIRERNAWNSTWVKHYLKNATMYTDVDSAKAGAERQRQRGNVFSIREVPAILLRGERSAVALTDAHPDNPFGAFTATSRVQDTPFGRYVTGIYPGVSVYDAVQTFGHDSGFWTGPRPNVHSLRTGKLDTAVQLRRIPKTLYAATSFGQGSNYYLGWKQQDSRHVSKAARQLAKQWQDMLASAELGASPSRDDLVRHRDDVLQAFPHSAWKSLKAAAIAQAQQDFDRASTEWEELSDLASTIEEETWDAEVELEEARRDRLQPADTSRGVREQRERVERAVERLEHLRLSAQQGEAAADAAWKRRSAAHGVLRSAMVVR
ncbi:hypothetical protein IEZ26_15800 [Nocardioides cavernae]|uniref:Uncharacterized protein n=1 Tax=Nocardioides cavernae TaxID=1921566 RepID=A0ABR8ND83_9ACTN|nr:hypothetical protein [Nocardioides cavernae]MBD3926088.1 hypothetical protein [Nocardioides cavernae]MBM7513677.1 hypothetical protein [Nocardioides cavernae]